MAGSITICWLEEPGPNELSDQTGVRISVQDQGMGIPPDALSRMFTRFFRVEGSAHVAASKARASASG